MLSFQWTLWFMIVWICMIWLKVSDLINSSKMPPCKRQKLTEKMCYLHKYVIHHRRIRRTEQITEKTGWAIWRLCFHTFDQVSAAIHNSYNFWFQNFIDPFQSIILFGAKYRKGNANWVTWSVNTCCSVILTQYLLEMSCGVGLKWYQIDGSSNRTRMILLNIVKMTSAVKCITSEVEGQACHVEDAQAVLCTLFQWNVVKGI